MAKFLSLIILPLLTFLPCSNASSQSMLSTGSSLSVDEYKQTFLTSPDGGFSCDFYQTTVWSANPKSPVNGQGSKVLLNHDGNLVLTDGNGTVTWDIKTSSGKGTAVILLDSGNLVIRNGNGEILWGSFSSPTDTLLPFQPLTRGTIVSGYKSLYFDNNNVLRLMYDGPDISSIYWPKPSYNVLKSGWVNYNSSRIAVLDAEGCFLSSDGLKENSSDWGTLIKRRLTLDYDGNLRIYSLNASSGSWTVTLEAITKVCNVHGLCGQNGICMYSPSLHCSYPPGYEMADQQNWKKGCWPKFSESWNISYKAEDFEFIQLPHTDFYGYDVTYNESVSLEGCKKACLEICSCSGFTYKTGPGLCCTKDILFNGYCYPNFPGDNYIKLPKNLGISTSLVSRKSHLTCNRDIPEIVEGSASMHGMNIVDKNWRTYYVFAAILGALVLIFTGTSWWFLSSKQDIPKSMEAGYRMVPKQFRMFTHRELKEATGKFKEEIGRGGSGIVYRGVLEDKRVVAVKKLTNFSHSEEELWAEMSIIGRINHMNLVRMWGFCSEGQHKLLVYEYVENESLDRGTMGHMAPEWALNFPINAKVDVYSYGVVLLEIVTGTRISSGITVDGREIGLTQIVQVMKQFLESGDVKDTVDHRLQGHFNPEKATAMLKVALACLEERNSRPTMNDIVVSLLACAEQDDHLAYSG
uniref:non-specific serine/threonine protein kinase n=1 Tax=Setaria italica TaxID=4555 RepID=K3XPE3_SETIT